MAFEQAGSRTIYDYLGIRWFKKYLPSSGDLVRRWRKDQPLTREALDHPQALYQLELKTRNYEMRHIVGALLFIGLVIAIDKKLTVFDVVFLTVLNLLVNVYPVFLQRFNRIRIRRLIKIKKLHDPYGAF